jgi:hypothetical protein
MCGHEMRLHWQKAETLCGVCGCGTWVCEHSPAPLRKRAQEARRG